ncbi:hypothetical protein COOONC_13127, partial [Cooperia oncophora]
PSFPVPHIHSQVNHCSVVLNYRFVFHFFENYSELVYLFQHAISLPLFSLMGADIMAAAMKFNKSAPFEVAGVTIPVPSLWMNLFFSCVLQYVVVENHKGYPVF